MVSIKSHILHRRIAIRAMVSIKSHILHRRIARWVFAIVSFVWRAVLFQSGDLCIALRALVSIEQSAGWWSAQIIEQSVASWGAVITRTGWRGLANWRGPGIS